MLHPAASNALRCLLATVKVPSLFGETDVASGSCNTDGTLPEGGCTETGVVFDKFIYTEIKGKSGIPIRGGLARPVSWMWMFKNYSIKDWVQFIEVFGMPLRIGKFAPGTSPDDQSALLRAVISMASDAGCIIPSNMTIDVVEASKSGGAGADVFNKFCSYVDDLMSKLVLGQTGTTDANPSGFGAATSKTVHNDVRGDIERADAAALSVALTQQLVIPYVQLNVGPQVRYPQIVIGRPEEQDAALMELAAKDLVPYGLRIRQQDLRRAFGFSEPAEGDEVLERAPPPPNPFGSAPPGLPHPFGQPALPMLPKPAMTAAQSRLALLASEMLAKGDDQIAKAAHEQVRADPEILRPLLDQIVAAAHAAKTPDQFRAHLRQIEPDMTPLADKLAMLAFQSLAGAILGETN